VWFDPQVKLPPLLGDAGKLGEAVQHLLHNAIKFNKVGGEIRIEYDVNDSHLSLHVIDSGVGISPERLDTIWTSLGNIYDPYIQGSGLGLALTQFIIAAHGGYVTAESNYGSGSKFSIHLPLLLAEDEAP
jgi:signal transduction histidine kinase